jgi:hypothetical protein
MSIEQPRKASGEQHVPLDPEALGEKQPRCRRTSCNQLDQIGQREGQDD